MSLFRDATTLCKQPGVPMYIWDVASCYESIKKCDVNCIYDYILCYYIKIFPFENHVQVVLVLKKSVMLRKIVG